MRRCRSRACCVPLGMWWLCGAVPRTGGPLGHQSPSWGGGCRGPGARALRGGSAGCRRGSEPRDTPAWLGTPGASHRLRPSPVRWLRGPWVAQQPGPRWPCWLGARWWLRWLPRLPLVQLVPSSARHWGGWCWGNRQGPGGLLGGMKLGVGAGAGRWLAEPGAPLGVGAGAGGQQSGGIPAPWHRARPSARRPPSHWGRSGGAGRRGAEALGRVVPCRGGPAMPGRGAVAMAVAEHRGR